MDLKRSGGVEGGLTSGSWGPSLFGLYKELQGLEVQGSGLTCAGLKGYTAGSQWGFRV